jgi:hypothetical protein
MHCFLVPCWQFKRKPAVRLAAYVRPQKRLDLPPLPVTEPKQVASHHLLISNRIRLQYFIGFGP